MAKKRANGEGNIRKRKDGRWEGRYTAGYDEKTGKRIIKSVLGKTQAEVKEKLANAVAEAESIDVRRILPPEQIKSYLTAAEQRGVLPMFYLELISGLRKGELTAMQRQRKNTERRREWHDHPLRRSLDLSPCGSACGSRGK